MPGYVPPEEFEDPAPSPCGLVTEGAVESQALGGSRRVSVYTPAGYRGDAGHPVLVLMDMRTRQVSRVLDRLIAHRSIEPVVAVFAEPQPRGGDYPEPSALRTFIADEVLAWLASKYGVAGPAGKRAIVGISYRAKDALDIAARSGAYDCLGLLIPGRRLGPADIQGLARLRERRLRVAILAGRYDQANVPTARHLRRALTDAGHEVDYTEVPEGHSATTWTSHLRTVLVSLFGRR